MSGARRVARPRSALRSSAVAQPPCMALYGALFALLTVVAEAQQCGCQSSYTAPATCASLVASASYTCDYWTSCWANGIGCGFGYVSCCNATNGCSSGDSELKGFNCCSDCSSGCADYNSQCRRACPAFWTRFCFRCNAGSYMTGHATDSYLNYPTSMAGYTSCTVASSGYYAAGGTATIEQTICPAGRFGTGGSSSSTCTGACLQGYYCPAGSASSAPSATQCPAGRYGAGGSGDRLCTGPCGTGRFGSSVGAINQLCSGACAQGSYCPAGSTSATQNACGVGNYCPAGAGAPTPCPAGKFCAAGATNATTACGVTAAFPAGNSPSVYCPAATAHEVVLNPGQLAKLVSGQSYYGPPDACPAGSYCTAGVATPCPAGTFNPSASMSALSNCKQCPAGYFCAGGTADGYGTPCGTSTTPGTKAYCGAGVTAVGLALDTSSPTFMGEYTAPTSNPAAQRTSVLPCVTAAVTGSKPAPAQNVYACLNGVRLLVLSFPAQCATDEPLNKDKAATYSVTIAETLPGAAAMGTITTFDPNTSVDTAPQAVAAVYGFTASSSQAYGVQVTTGGSLIATQAIAYRSMASADQGRIAGDLTVARTFMGVEYRLTCKVTIAVTKIPLTCASKGQYMTTEDDTSTCNPCPPGSWCNGVFKTACTSGTYAGGSGAVVCDICPADHFSAFAQSLECIKCPNGTKAVPGSSTCLGQVSCGDSCSDSSAPPTLAIVVPLVMLVFWVAATCVYFHKRPELYRRLKLHVVSLMNSTSGASAHTKTKGELEGQRLSSEMPELGALPPSARGCELVDANAYVDVVPVAVALELAASTGQYADIAAAAPPACTFKQLSGLQHLAHGSTAQVFRCKFRGRPVVFKQLHNARTDPAVLAQEAALHLLIQRDSPFVVQLLATCAQPPGLVYECMEGGSLEERFVRDAASVRSDCGELLRALGDAAQGLAHLHACGVVHRDVAARNFLAAGGGGGRVKISDFGMSRIRVESEQGYSRTNSSSLPVRWMAPECIQDVKDSMVKFNTATDMYSFGVLIWELCHRALPYGKMAIHEVMLLKLTKSAAASKLQFDGAVAAQLPALAQLFETCCAADPTARPAAADVARQLNRQLMLLPRQQGGAA